MEGLVSGIEKETNEAHLLAKATIVKENTIMEVTSRATIST